LLIDRVLKIFFPNYNRDFDIAYYTFNLLFSQALIWIGTYYSPFLTGLQIIKLLIIFFIEAVILKPERDIIENYYLFWFSIANRKNLL
jgi:hypothetical protein